MDASTVQAPVEFSARSSLALGTPWLSVLREGTIERAALILGVAMVPISIAATESFLAIAVVARLIRCWRGEARVAMPRVFWAWLALAVAEYLAWVASPSLRDGWSEIRHLLLVGSLFFVLTALDGAAACLAAWQAVFLSSALGSLFLIGDFISRLVYYRREIGSSYDISLYLRTGGLLSNWMVYGTVEILVVAGLLSFWFAYPDERRRFWPVMALNGLAIILSPTRTVWVSCFLLLAILLWKNRSRWMWALPFLPLAVYFLSPSAVRSRINVASHLDYYSNAERIQMMRVGWRMIREHPWAGVGPGRIERLYRGYLSPSDPVPAYHGHLHNNLIQMAAQFGIPVALASVLFAMILFCELRKASKEAKSREEQFLCQAAFLSLIGFLVAGCFDYTYGHSLALVLLAYAVLLPLFLRSRSVSVSGIALGRGESPAG
ncbi:MAG: hypothetical protein DMG21_04975 [Acidobacteria bacterium]|nr:MAG: hypothetical protein DMG21_04975 [Acidobacteriota bacterium]